MIQDIARAQTLILLLVSGGAASAECAAPANGAASAKAALVGSAERPDGAGQFVDRVVFAQVPTGGRSGPADDGGSQGVPPGLPLSSRIVSLDPSSADQGVTNLTPSFAAAGFPDLSFDARRILFVGKQEAGDPLHVWEMNVDGGGLRRVTDAGGPAVAAAPAIYLSTIYTIDADEPVYQIAFSADEDGGSLYTCRLDGTRPTRITFNPYGCFDPFILSDGRLLCGIGLPPGETGYGTSAAGGTALVTINTDGTDLFAFAGMHEPTAMRGMPCETPDGLVVYVESEAGSADRGGKLVAVARTRSLHTRRVIAEEPGGRYRSPSVANPGTLLISYLPRDGDSHKPVGDLGEQLQKRRSRAFYGRHAGRPLPASTGSYGINLLDIQSGRRIAELYDDPNWHDIDAVAVCPRPRPKGRSSVVDGRRESGWLYCMDAYMSNRAEAARIEEGQIRRLRVIQALSNTPGRPGGPQEGANSGVAEKVLGEVEVEADGSFFLEVPARTPLRLETLDEQGEVLQGMVSWVWVMPKEARGCIGCHEDRELTPPNRHALALRKAAQRVGVSGVRELEPDRSKKSPGGEPK